MKKIIIPLCLVIVVLAGLTIYLNLPKTQYIKEIDEQIIYRDKECEPTYCNPEIVEYFVDDLATNDNIIAIVKGSIYEKNNNLTVFGSCLNSSSNPIETNASLSIYYPNSTTWLQNISMKNISTGKFYFENTTPETTGTYLLEFNCTDAEGDWAVDYGEFQNSPSWIDKISGMFTNIQNLVLAQHTEFKISRLETGNPKYANDSIVVEAGFTNGTIVSPEEINLSVYYPNNTLWFEAHKTDFTERSNHIWRYNDTKIPSSGTPVGMYSVNLWANNSKGLEAVKAVQFMVRSGGPYSVEIDCPISVSAGTDLVCTVTLLDEGSNPTESTTEVWVDTDRSETRNNTEPQTSFSKQTNPGESVEKSISINIPSNHNIGYYIVRVETTYTGSKDVSRASDGVTINPYVPPEIEAPGAGDGAGVAGGPIETCEAYSQKYKVCYIFNDLTWKCELGCLEGFVCNEKYECVEKVKVKEIPEITLGFFQKMLNWIRSWFGPVTLQVYDESTGQVAEIEIKEKIEWQKIQQHLKENPLIVLIMIIGIIALVLLLHFGILQKIIAWIIANWQWILIVVIILFSYWYFKSRGLIP